MSGMGTFTWPSGQIFKGMYSGDRKHGKGELKLSDGTLIKGEWVEGRL